LLHWLPVLGAWEDSISPAGGHRFELRGQNFYTDATVTIDGVACEVDAAGSTESYDSLFVTAPAHVPDSVELVLTTQYGGRDTVGIIYYDSAVVSVLNTYITGYRLRVTGCRDSVVVMSGDGEIGPVFENKFARANPETVFVSGTCYAKKYYYSATTQKNIMYRDSLITLNRTDSIVSRRWYPDSAFAWIFSPLSNKADSCGKMYRGATMADSTVAAVNFSGTDSTAVSVVPKITRVASGQYKWRLAASEVDFGTRDSLQVEIDWTGIEPKKFLLRRIR